jgi:hypothetical protein
MIRLSDAHADAVREILEILLADEANQMGFIDTTSSGGCSPEQVATLRACWREVYDVLCAPNFYADGHMVDLLGDNGEVWVRAVTAGRAGADGDPLVHFLRPDGTPVDATVSWPSKYMRAAK